MLLYLGMATTKLRFLYLKGYEDDVFPLILIVIAFWICFVLGLRQIFRHRKLRNLQRRGVLIDATVLKDDWYTLRYRFDVKNYKKQLLVYGYVRQMNIDSMKSLGAYSADVNGLIELYCEPYYFDAVEWVDHNHIHYGVYQYKDVLRTMKGNARISIRYDSCSPRNNMPADEFNKQYRTLIATSCWKCLCYTISIIAVFAVYSVLAVILQKDPSGNAAADLFWTFALFLVFSAECVVLLICFVFVAYLMVLLYLRTCGRFIYYEK